MNQPTPPNKLPLFVTVDSVVELFEKLGVCIAIAAGAVAIVHFREKLISFCPTVATVYGFILLFGALLLALFVGSSWFVEHTAGKKNNIVVYALAALVTVTTILFFIAGVFAAIATINT